MNNYVAFYNCKRHELVAPTSHAAHLAAAVWFKAPAKKAYMISIVLADKPIDTASL